MSMSTKAQSRCPNRAGVQALRPSSIDHRRNHSAADRRAKDQVADQYKRNVTDPDTGNSRRGKVTGRLQPINLKLTSSSAFTTDRRPLQPFSRLGSPVERLQQSSSRWSSGSQAAFDTASSNARVCHRIIVQPYSVSSLKYSDAMQNYGEFETSLRFGLSVS
jgi:hypothetical protein